MYQAILDQLTTSYQHTKWETTVHSFFWYQKKRHCKKTIKEQKMQEIQLKLIMYIW